jgi:copper chaperone
MKPLTLHITGMSCGHCLNAVSSALSKLPGVTIQSVRIGRAELEHDPDTTSPEAIVAAVADAGYSAVPASS